MRSSCGLPSAPGCGSAELGDGASHRPIPLAIESFARECERRDGVAEEMLGVAEDEADSFFEWSVPSGGSEGGRDGLEKTSCGTDVGERGDMGGDEGAGGESGMSGRSSAREAPLA